MISVTIRGGGFAAACCVRLLTMAGIRPAVELGERPRVPAIMIGETTQRLLADIFDRRDLFDGLHRVHKRIVVWGRNRDPVTLPHSAIVVSEAELMGRLGTGQKRDDSGDTAENGWTIVTSRAEPAPATVYDFGSRIAEASAVGLKAGVDSHACAVESLPNGWLFLLPTGPGCAWLLSVGDRRESLLADSRLVAKQIAAVDKAVGQFPSHPRITHPLTGAGWLRCGSAALSFDPLCGDGTGHAAREAILGTAVIRAAGDGADIHAVTGHYRNRLVAGFRRHLEACREFYESGSRGPWWTHQIDEIRRGLQWTAEQLQAVATPQFRLNGFSLERID
ncbi:MAG: hypothetical protein C5B51_07225 [Terriglobia bacterium]|nr:MAG: hypothetical protein C5B51_07225 [Terriglobia bacterium]